MLKVGHRVLVWQPYNEKYSIAYTGKIVDIDNDQQLVMVNVDTESSLTSHLFTSQLMERYNWQDPEYWPVEPDWCVAYA